MTRMVTDDVEQTTSETTSEWLSQTQPGKVRIAFMNFADERGVRVEYTYNPSEPYVDETKVELTFKAGEEFFFQNIRLS